MLRVITIQLIGAWLAFGWGTISMAASFDCGEALTKAEIAICSDPDLSALDELISSTYFSIGDDGRYVEAIQKVQRAWVSEYRQPSTYDFRRQLNFLEIASTANSCSTVEKSFIDCQAEIDDVFDRCMASENYTTIVMNRCSSAYLSALTMIDDIETKIRRSALGNDQETLELFDVAHDKWREFVKADCEWQYSEYRGGTIRGQIWFGCQLQHYEKRIIEINLSNLRLSDT